MEYVKLGTTGMEVSPLCVGGMGFAEGSLGVHPWALDEATSHGLIKLCLDAGLNFFDTANAYSDGTAEEFLGRALARMANRDEIVIATKVFFRMRPGPNGDGLSRKAIMTEIDASLKRLGTDYVDLYQIHRWDYGTPIEETLEALDDVVRAGKARYIGASSMFAWQLAKALHVSERNGWARFATMQNHYNLLYREEEREMLPLCLDAGVGVIPWSPLARGRLTRPWDAGTGRSESDELGKSIYRDDREDDAAIVGRVLELAEQLGVAPARVALAWVLQAPAVTAPIVGITKPKHLEDAVAALDLELDSAMVAALEEPYEPHPVAGHA